MFGEEIFLAEKSNYRYTTKALSPAKLLRV